jgi:4'-phosphopantetheinyl transferase
MRVAEGEVHVWAAHLDELTPETSRFLRLLAPEEKERAARFYRQTDCDHFLCARGVLRSLLAGYAGIAPEDLAFRCNAYGKPYLAEEGALQFNVSHSHGLALYAIASGREIGIDVEWIRQTPDLMKIAGRFFSPREVRELEAAPPESQLRAFFRCWTRKEAYIKAKGLGLSIPLKDFSVSSADGGPSAVVASESGWHVWNADPAPGYLGALAVEASECKLVVRKFSPSGL